MRHGDVVEEEKRFSAGAEGVVDAHRDEVDADGMVNAGVHGHLELRAHAVGAGDEQRIFVAPAEESLEVELEERREAALGAHHPRALGAPHVRGQTGHTFAVELEIDAGAGVGGSAHGHHHRRVAEARKPAPPVAEATHVRAENVPVV